MGEVGDANCSEDLGERRPHAPSAGQVTLELFVESFQPGKPVFIFRAALAVEVADFGIKVMIIEPGAFHTEFQSSIKKCRAIAEYEAAREKLWANAAQGAN
jgi:hypothetical protein